MSVSYGTGTYKIEDFEVAKVILTNTVPVDATACRMTIGGRRWRRYEISAIAPA
jgi:hypothetical protein